MSLKFSVTRIKKSKNRKSIQSSNREEDCDFSENSISLKEDEKSRIVKEFRDNAVTKDRCSICSRKRPNIVNLCCGQVVHITCIAKKLKRKEACNYCHAEMLMTPMTTSENMKHKKITQHMRKKTKSVEYRVVKEFRENAMTKECCSICFEDGPNIATLCCGQAIHIACMIKWLNMENTQKSCHCCRSEISSTYIAPTAPTIRPIDSTAIVRRRPTNPTIILRRAINSMETLVTSIRRTRTRSRRQPEISVTNNQITRTAINRDDALSSLPTPGNSFSPGPSYDTNTPAHLDVTRSDLPLAPPLPINHSDFLSSASTRSEPSLPIFPNYRHTFPNSSLPHRDHTANIDISQSNITLPRSPNYINRNPNTRLGLTQRPFIAISAHHNTNHFSNGSNNHVMRRSVFHQNHLQESFDNADTFTTTTNTKRLIMEPNYSSTRILEAEYLRAMESRPEECVVALVNYNSHTRFPWASFPCNFHPLRNRHAFGHPLRRLSPSQSRRSSESSVNQIPDLNLDVEPGDCHTKAPALASSTETLLNTQSRLPESIDPLLRTPPNDTPYQRRLRRWKSQRFTLQARENDTTPTSCTLSNDDGFENSEQTPMFCNTSHAFPPSFVYHERSIPAIWQSNDYEQAIIASSSQRQNPMFYMNPMDTSTESSRYKAIVPLLRPPPNDTPTRSRVRRWKSQRFTLQARESDTASTSCTLSNDDGFENSEQTPMFCNATHAFPPSFVYHERSIPAIFQSNDDEQAIIASSSQRQNPMLYAILADTSTESSRYQLPMIINERWIAGQHERPNNVEQAINVSRLQNAYPMLHARLTQDMSSN